MKKTLLSIAAIASIVSVASADDAWFNGNIGGSTASGGSWDSGVAGVTLVDTESPAKYALEDVEAFKFTATESKSVSGSANLSFTSAIKFQYAYDELPAIGATDKAGVIAFGEDNPTYYVLAKDGTTNAWTNTELPATLDPAVVVNVVISNGNNSVWAIYKIGEATAKTYEIVASDAFQFAQYSGSGEINSLIGQLIALGYPIPGNKTIATDAAEAWAASMGYSKTELAAILISETVYAGNRTAAESCILGVNTNDEINASIDDTGVAANALKFTVQVSGPIAGHTVSYQLKKDGKATDVAAVGKTFTPDFSEGEYSIVAFVDGANKEIPVSKTMGVKNAPEGFGASAAAGFLAVPYTGAEGDIAIANLFKKALLVNGDHLDVFDSETAGWKTFTFNGTAWEGVQKGAGEPPDPAATTIKRGQAFKLTRPEALGMSAPVYLGYVSTASATVSLPSKKYELVADPAGSTVSVDKLGDSDWAAKVDVNAKTPNVMYKKIGGVWKKIEYVDGKATATAVEAIDGAFFFLNRGAEAKELDFSK